MSRIVWVVLHCLLFVPVTVGQDRPLSTEVDALRQELQEIEGKLSVVNAKVEERERQLADLKLIERMQEAEKHLAEIFAVGALVIPIVGLALTLGIIDYLKRWAQDTLLKEAKDELRGDLKTRFDAETQSMRKALVDNFADLNSKLERQISDLIVVLLQTERGQHDEAIEAIGWDGELASLQAYPEAIRKLVIEAALQGRSSRHKYGEVAWEAAEQIIQEIRSEVNLSFLYQLAASSHSWPRGYEYYERYGKETSIRTNPEGFLALLRILRRGVDFKSLLHVQEEYEGPETPSLVHYLGHIQNNLGNFEKADSLLAPEVEGIVRLGPDKTPPNWVKVTYSFLLNCVEWDRPDRGLDAARFAIRARGDTLLQLGVLRLALQLEAAGKSTDAAELIEGVRRNISHMPEDSMALQTQARLMAYDHRGSDGAQAAVDFLRQHESWVLSKKTTQLLQSDRNQALSEKDLVLPRAEYFYVCLIGEMLIEADKHEEAREVLYKLTLNDQVGEAYFFVALSYAKEQADQEAIRNLERAGLIHRRWCRIAEQHPELRASHRRLGLKPCHNVPELPTGEDDESVS